MTEQAPLKRTPLYEEHLRLGAKLVPFAGWEMPVQYPLGLKAEHCMVREDVGIFDVSHMGEVFVRGPEAVAALQHLTCNDVAKLADNEAQYSALLNSQGGVIDDVIVYRIHNDDFLVCVNAGNTDAAFEWMHSNAQAFRCTVTNESSQYGQLAVQGPRAWELMRTAFGDVIESVQSLAPFSFSILELCTAPRVIVARTGYTGEDGAELFIPTAHVREVFATLLEHAPQSPCGLGARDTLRLEVCYPLHGHELRTDLSALESGLGWIVKFQKGDFIGREALEREKQGGVKRRLVGFEVRGSGIARDGALVLDSSGEDARQVGFVTSGTLTPTLGRAVGMALVETDCAEPGTDIVIEVRGRRIDAQVVKKPLYKKR